MIKHSAAGGLPSTLPLGKPSADQTSQHITRTRGGKQGAACWIDDGRGVGAGYDASRAFQHHHALKAIGLGLRV